MKLKICCLTNEKKFFLFVCFALLNLVSACTNNIQIAPTQEFEKTPLPILNTLTVTPIWVEPTRLLSITLTVTKKLPSPSSTPSPTPISSNIPVFTLTPTQNPDNFSNIPNGKYILYFTEQSPKITFSLISIDGKVQKDLFTLAAVGAHISEDKKQVILYQEKSSPYLLNLVSMKKDILPFSQECSGITLSKDNQYFLGACPIHNSGIDIFRYPRNGGEGLSVTHCSDDHGSCLYVHFSPDGKWISYTRIGPSIYKSAKDGLYFAPAECVQSNEGCDNVAIGPYDLNSPNPWSSDSQQITDLGLDNIIRIYQFDNGNIYYQGRLNQKGIENLTDFISLDSKRVICEIINDIYILDVESMEFTKIKSSDEYLYILTWMEILDGEIVN